MRRLITVRDTVNAMMEEVKPSLAFNGKSTRDWMLWRRKFLKQLRSNLGRFPHPVALRAEVVERVDVGSYVREKVVYNTERYASVPAYVLIPKGIKPGEKRPALLCAHGHGRGKVDVVGITASKEEYGQFIKPLNYDFARQFAERGYVVIAPDWRGFGERAPDKEWVREGRDGCNVNYLALGYFGYHLLTLQIWDGIRTIDYIQSRKEVDPKRIGCIGLSFGGTMATYLSALDRRIKASVVSCYISTIRWDALGDRGKVNTCGAQYSPGLLLYGDIADVAGLIAPKPLLVEMGENDTCFVIDDALRAYDHLKKIYAASGHLGMLEVDRFTGAHEFSGRMAFEWFDRWLWRKSH